MTDSNHANLQAELDAALQRISALESQLAALSDPAPRLRQELAELGLGVSDNDFQFLIQNTNVVIWVMDLAAARFTYVSPGVKKLRGYSVEEVLEQRMDQALTAESLALLQEELPKRLARFLAGDPDASSSTDILGQPCKDGSTVWTEATATFIKTADEAVKVLGISRDITRRRQAEAKLHSSEARIHAFFKQSWDGILVLDEDGLVIEWNQALVHLTGISRDKAIGQPFWILQAQLTPEEKRIQHNPEVIRRALKDGITSGKSPLFLNASEWTLQKASGEQTPILQTVFPIKTEDGLYVGGFMRDISERSRAQEALRRYELLANHSRDIILFIRKEDGQILEANLAAVQTYGYSREELLGLTIKDLRLDTPTLVADQMTQAEKSSGLLFTTRHRRKDGSSFPAEVSSQGAQISGVHTLVSVIRDISEREEINALRADSEEKFSKAFHTSPQLMAFTDMETHTYIDVNDSFLRTLGYNRDEVVGRSTRELQVFADPVYVRDNALALLSQNGHIQNLEIDIRKKNGEICHGLFFGEYVQLQNKKILFTVMNDITQRKQVERALSESENRHRVIFEGANEGIAAIDAQTHAFHYANPAMCVLFGYTPEEFSQLSIDDLHPADWIGRVMNEFDEIVHGERRYMSAIACRRKDGSRFYADIAASLTEINAAKMVIGFFSDVTERRRNEALAKARVWLNQLPAETSMDNLIQQTLDQAETISDSHIGFFHFIDDDQVTISLQNWSTNTIRNMCTAEGKGQHYPVEQAGVWAESLRKRQPVIINNYPGHPERKGMPVGHAQVTRLISVPVMRGGKITALIGVGNKEIDYDQRDVEVVALLASETWDIILRKRMENELRESEELYRTLIESQEAIITMLDQDGVFHYANPIAAAFAGKTPEEMSGAKIRDLFPSKFALSQAEVAREVIQSGVGKVVETRLGTDGKPRWFRTSVQPIRNSEGKITLALVNSVDITIQKDTELILEGKVQDRTNEIEAVRQRLELATSAAGIGIWDWNIRTGLMIWDERMFQIYNIPNQGSEVSIQTWESCLHPDDIANQRALNEAVFRKESEYKTEYRVIWPDKSEHILGSEGIAIFDEDGQPERMIGIDYEITARKQAENVLRRSEEVLRSANHELERAMRTKDEFLASMSHELRTPLTSILGLSEALQQQVYGDMNPNQTKALKNIESSGHHLLNLINDILDVSKIESGKFEMQFNLNSLVEICQSSLQLVKGIAHKKQLKVAFSINPATINLWCDARRMKQILVNLLSNAVKFTPEGSSIGLDVEAKEEEQTIYLCVWDKGIGIKAQDLQRIFQPFVQLDSSLAREQSGTGLGLVLVQRMIEMHEGSLHVESTPGAGSRFEIILPWKGFKGADQEAIRQEALGQPLLIQRTMTVEDNEIDAGHLTRFLNKMGIENIVLNQGRFISQHALELQPEIILLDISLPDQSGWSVLHELKSNQATKAIPVIITSVEDKRAEATRLGAAAYLVKPFTFLDLREALGRAAAALRSPTTGPSSAAPLIMLVDDNEINSQTIIDFLEANRYRAMWVSNGWAFLDKAPQEHPDIILMDIQMPGIDGLEVIRRVRAHADKQFAESRIIANTALAMQGDRERCLSAGANEYLSKPFRLNELLAAIHKQLAGPM